MDEVVFIGDDVCWFVVMSFFFDILVFELFWMLCCGCSVVFVLEFGGFVVGEVDVGLSFSFFYFVVFGGEVKKDFYCFFLEGVEFVDWEGFEVVWVFECYFYEFGGLFFNLVVVVVVVVV